MDWLHLSGGAPSLMLIPLGTCCKNKYYTSEQCLLCLEDLTRQLNCDDTNHSRRRGLGYVDILNKDLKPILISSYRSSPKIYRLTVKLLVGITTPIECLVSDGIFNRSSPYIAYELKQLLYKAKEAFLDLCATRAIITHAKLLLVKQPMSSDETEFLNLSLVLIRNILDAPERPVEPGPQMVSYSESYSREFENFSQQNEIVFNLFAQGLGKLLLDMLASSQMDHQWAVTIVQVIGAIYKDQSVENIQAQLSIMIESSTDVSFNKDGTHHLPWPSGLELQPPCHALMQTLSVDIMSSASSKSALSDNEQKITNKRRRKTYSRTSGRTLEKRLSNEHAISRPLAQFTIDFMLNGFSVLVKELLQQSKQRDDRLLDKSQFLWLLVNFLPLAFQLGQKPEFLREVLTIDLLGYLVWVVVRETEEVQLNSRDVTVDPKPSLRRLHLGVRAISEYLQALEKYSLVENSRNSENSNPRRDEEWVFQLRRNVMAMNELRQLFLLQLRQFNSEIQSHQYLCDIISANHALLLTLEQATKYLEYGASFDLSHHLNQFCTSNITARYGAALQEFRTNDNRVNDSIFTMLHCIGCDFGRLDLLCQPIILRPLCKIWETEFEICNDWHDLIERLVQKSMENKIDGCGMFSPQSSGRKSPDNESLLLIQSDQQPLTIMTEQFTSNHDPFMETYGDIESLICQLTIAGYDKQLAWIQSSLLTACATRLGAYAGREFRYPVSCSCMTMKIPCPMVPWTELEASGLHSEHFRCLLQKMGLVPHSSQIFFYPKIPFEWSADILYSFCLLFGPINENYVDFDLTLVKKVNLPMFSDF